MQQEFDFQVSRANELFSSKSVKGWRTDRGRIHILYGLADELHSLPLESNCLVFHQFEKPIFI